MSRGFTLVEMLVVIAIIAVLAGLGFTAFKRSIRAANASRDMSTMRQIWQSVPTYAADNNGFYPGPLYTGQKSLFGGESTGRISHYITSYLGVRDDNLKRGDIVEPMVFTWQKTDAQINAPCFYIREKVPVNYEETEFIRPWGYPTRGTRKPLSQVSVLSQVDPSVTWAMSDLDQKHPDIGSASWKSDIPAEMSHGDHRIAIFFDGHAGQLDVNNEIK